MALPTTTAVAARLAPAGTPLLRDGLQRLSERLQPPGLDPAATPGDPGLFGPDSPTWRVMQERVHGLSGARAALLQTLSVPIPSATHNTGSFYDDFLGRVGRTGVFVEQQCLGSMDEVLRSARRVRAMHAKVRGATPSGLAYDASDPHQQAWVSMTLTDSMLTMVERFGEGPLAPADADRFVHEQSVHGALLDPRLDLDAVRRDPELQQALRDRTLPLPLIEEGELPTTVAQLRSLMGGWTSELRVNGLTRVLLDVTVRTQFPLPVKAALRPWVLAVLSTIPEPWHAMIAPVSHRWEERLAAASLAPGIGVLRGLSGPNPAVAVARARVAAGRPALAA